MILYSSSILYGRTILYSINIKYNDKLIENNKMFNELKDILISKHGKSIFFESQSKVQFQIIFNDKINYSLEDSFDLDLGINESVLSKIENHIENAITLNNSKDISAIDDIWIDDF